MMRWRKGLKLRYGTKLFVTFSLVLVLVVILLSITVYIIYAKDRTKAIVEANLRALSMTSFSAEFMHANARELLVSQFNDSGKQIMMYGDRLDALTLREERNKLIDQVASNIFVDSIHVYNQKQNLIISSSWQSFGTRSTFYDHELMQLLQAPVERSAPIVREIPTVKEGGMKDVYTYILYDYHNLDNGVEGAVILNIKSSYLDSLVRSFEGDQRPSTKQRDVIIVDKNGWIVSPTARKKELRLDKLTQLVTSEVLTSGASSGHFIYRYEGKAYIVTHVNSSPIGWKFIDIQDYNEQLTVINQIRRYSITMAILFLILGLLTSFIVSRRLAGPLRSILGKVTGTSHNLIHSSDQLNEWTTLEMIINKTLPYYQQADSLRKHEFLKSVLLTGPQGQSQNHMANHHQLSIDFNKPYRIVLFEIDNFYAFSRRYQAADQRLLRYALRKAIEEHLGRSGFVGEVVDHSKRKQVLLLNWPQVVFEDAEHETIQPMLLAIQEWGENHLKMSLTVTLSDTIDSQATVDAFNDVDYLSQYRFMMGHRAFITRQVVSELGHDEAYKIPAALEKALAEAITAGNYEEAIGKLGQVFYNLREYRYEIVISNVRYMLFFLYNLLTLTSQSSGQSHSFDLNEYYEVLDGLETLSEAETFFQETVYRVTQVVKARQENRSAVISKHIISFIEQNYGDPNLSMDLIADYLNFSKVYISKVFRETYGQTIGDYILDYRMQKMMEGLTVRQDTSIEVLLEEVGIENKKYFSSLFKKRTGLSLRDFRLKAIEELNHRKSMQN